MEEMLTEAALPRAVERYCAGESNEEERTEGLNTVILQVHRGKVGGLNELVAGHLRPYLTSEEPFVRMRGTLLLAQLLQRLPDMKLEQHVMVALLKFFVERFRTDYDSAGPCVIALKTLLELHEKEFNLDMVEAVVTALLAAHHVPAMTQSLRYNIYQTMQIIFDRESYRAALKPSFDGFALVSMYADAMDSEKDPRCLLICLRVAAALLKEGTLRFQSDEEESRAVERIFDVSCVYFPIVFRPPSNDPFNIRAEDLWDVLHGVFKSHPFMAGHVIGLLIDKLNISSSDVAMAKVDSLKTLQICLPAYTCAAISPYLNELRDLLIRLVVNAEQATIADEAVATVSVISGMVAKQEEVVLMIGSLQQEHTQNWKDFVGNLVTDCTDAVNKNIDSMVGRASARIVAAVAQSSALGFGTVLEAVLPVASKWCTRPDASDSQHSAAFDIVSRLTHSINPDVDYAPGTNPMKPEHADTLFQILLTEIGRSMMDTVYDHSSTGMDTKKSDTLAARSTKRTALRSIQDLIVRPPSPVLSTDQIRDVVKTLSEQLVENTESLDDKDAPRAMCLEALIAIGKAAGVRSLAISEITVPLVERSSDSLDILADLCEVPQVFDTVLPHMLNNTEKQQRKIDQKLLGIIADIIESNKQYSEGLQKCCIPFSSSILLPVLVKGAVSKEIFLGEAGARVVRRLIRYLPEEPQSEVLASVLSTVPLSNDVASRNDERTQVVSAVVGSVRPSVLANADMLKLAGACRELSLETEAPTEVQYAAALCFASIINKGEETRFDTLVQETVPLFFTTCQSTSTPLPKRLASLEALTLLAKALAMKGANASAQDVSSKILGLLQSSSDSDSDFSFRLAQFFGDIIKPSNTTLNRASHAREALFFQQKYFGANFPKIKEAAAAATPGTIQYTTLLLAAVHLVEFVPKGVLLQDVNAILPFLCKALEENEIALQVSALASLHTIIENSLESAEPFLHTLVPRLLDLTKFQDGVLARHRALAIDSLLLFSTFPYNKIHSLRQKVAKGLLGALDDPKRPVRRRAVECRNKWLILQNV